MFKHGDWVRIVHPDATERQGARWRTEIFEVVRVAGEPHPWTEDDAEPVLLAPGEMWTRRMSRGPCREGLILERWVVAVLSTDEWACGPGVWVGLNWPRR